ncbi:ATP-binding cassette domain-containing protein [Acidianus sulfidivorans JP7]|uniref:ABC transporter domain-containing protein n=1 Tax=Acidianus sulfidivorans JP7 TaxID=619593 RepID=A0A2U9IL83_9CREN|nr:ATP-binding cassette domain-containing protein [Acidianus sulfidivorans]AWR96770.1 ATP-binding cassette domain-containing protein [Acidianus sulfidivorans JP7]
MLKAIHVYKTLNDDEILHDINLEIKRGDKIGLIGLHNSGKTVLLDILSGNIRPSRGKVIMDEQGNKFNRKKISYIPQIPILNLSYTPRELVKYIDGEEYFLEQLGINPNTKIRDLSLNEKKRIFLALSLNFSPEYLLIDEINDDQVLKKFFVEFKGGALVTSHSIKKIWDLIKDVIIINKGKIVYKGSKEDLLYKIITIKKEELTNNLNNYDYDMEGDYVEIWLKIKDKINGIKGKETLVDPDDVILRYYIRN